MAVLRFIMRSAGKMSILLVLIGVLASGFNAGLIAAVHQVLIAAHAPSQELMLAFVAMVLGKVVATYAAGAMLNSFSQESLTTLRADLIRKLLTVPFARLEKVGSARILAALTEDLLRIHGAMQSISSVIVNAAVVAGGAIYLVYLSPALFLWLALFGCAGIAVHLTLHRSANRLFLQARDLNGRLFEHFRDLTAGLKELKLHAGRRRAFLRRGVLDTTEDLMAARIAGQGRYLAAQAVTQLIVFFGIFALLFMAPGLDSEGEPQALISGYVLAALYLVGPLSGLLRGVPIFGMASIALSRIHATGADLGNTSQEPQETENSSPPTLARIDLLGACYEHQRFTLGPVDLTIVPGQITYISGENGSGKSSLGLLLAGLYAPTQGTVAWNEQPVTDDNRDHYRQLFSAVFFDFHLFRTLWGILDDDCSRHGQSWMSRLGLDHKVAIEQGRFSTLDLSQGQRRRLALAVALLEDRPIIVFDEFTADQDSEMKLWFYETLLPELRARDKAVVVISHDDRFFQHADQRIVLSQGRAHRVIDRAHSG